MIVALSDYVMKARGNWNNYTPTGAAEHKEDNETKDKTENKVENKELVQSIDQNKINELYD